MRRDAITAENFRWWVRRAEVLLAQRDRLAELVRQAVHGGFEPFVAERVLEVVDGDIDGKLESK